MTGIAKRVSALADGRELIYFDDADTTLPPDRASDPRPIIFWRIFRQSAAKPPFPPWLR
jgi:hypothetical protein